MKTKISLFSLMLIAAFISCAERDNPNDPLSGLFNMSASTSPASGSTITGNEPLTVTFSDPVTRTSISVGGTMASKAKAVVSGDWISDTQLTISPTTIWDSGSGTLTVWCTHLSGTGSVSGSASFSVEYVVYVNGSTGHDIAPGIGTKSNPYLTIQKGIDQADTLYTTASVRVSKGTGTYDKDFRGSSSVPLIDMKEGISIYGGYSNDFTTRGESSNITTIRDTSTTGGDNNTDPNRVINCSNTISTATVIDGFTIKIGGGTASTGIFCDLGDPTIQNNNIIGRTSSESPPSYSMGIYNNNSTPIIQNNTIDAKHSNTDSRAIFNRSASATIKNNSQIYGGTGTTTHGIYCAGASTPLITGNTIDGGSGTTTAYCIRIITSTPIINTNYFVYLPSNNSNGWGIYEGNSSSDPVSVQGNHFNFEPDTGTKGWYYDDGNANNPIQSLSTLIENNGDSTKCLSDWSNDASY